MSVIDNTKPKRNRTVPPPTSPSRLLGAKDAASYLGIPYTSLRDQAFRGKVPIVKFGTRWFFRREDLERLIEAHVERPA